MARMTKEQRAERKAERARADARSAECREETIWVVQTGKCPQCGAALCRNLALTGWWQCEQYGAEGFRKDSGKPSCSFQCFII